jgi:hypothetical protein
MNKNRVRLNLTRVTVRTLRSDELADAHGGEINGGGGGGGGGGRSDGPTTCVSTHNSCAFAANCGTVVTPRHIVTSPPDIIIVRP